MADGEEVTLDGRPLQALRVADLKAALEQRGLPKSGQKSALIKRLRGALMLENLQKHSTPHTTFQPNSQIGEEMSQNTIIKQYLEKQQELLRQRLEREARESADLESKWSLPHVLPPLLLLSHNTWGETQLVFEPNSSSCFFCFKLPSELCPIKKKPLW
uniref:SAP domain-containing protein n=1 Tax=Naja naja TaxID=35670 RepID=A0A8C6XRI7_NAJNA